jgi:serine/threonine protein kinase
MVIIFNYNIEKLIGKGSYSYVYSGFDVSNKNEEYAFKLIKTNKLNDQIMAKAKIEVEILYKLNHPNIVKIHNNFYHDSIMYIVLEKCSTDLDQLIHSHNSSIFITKELKLQWCKELLDGILYLHSNKIIHRDLKPKNILIGKNNSIRISDFGFAKLIDSDDIYNNNNMRCSEISDNCITQQDVAGTPLYMSPELLTSETHKNNYKTDYWSLGIILYFILTGCVPFGAKNITELMLKIKNIVDIKIPIHVADQYDTDIIHLIESMLIVSNKHRISYEQLLLHPFNNKNKKMELSINTKINIYESYDNLLFLNSPLNKSLNDQNDTTYLNDSNILYESSYSDDLINDNKSDDKIDNNIYIIDDTPKTKKTKTTSKTVSSPIKIIAQQDNSPKNNYYGYYEDNISNGPEEIFKNTRMCYSAPVNDSNMFLHFKRFEKK